MVIVTLLLQDLGVLHSVAAELSAAASLEELRTEGLLALADGTLAVTAILEA
jgi:hypothetical protein